MGIDFFVDFSDWSSGLPLDLDSIEHETEEDAYHPVRRKGHLSLIGEGIEAEEAAPASRLGSHQ